MFESVVAVAFQSVFHAEMHQNNVFLKIFLRSAYQNNSKQIKKLIFYKKQILIFLKTRVGPCFQTEACLKSNCGCFLKYFSFVSK